MRAVKRKHLLPWDTGSLSKTSKPLSCQSSFKHAHMPNFFYQWLTTSISFKVCHFSHSYYCILSMKKRRMCLFTKESIIWLKYKKADDKQNIKMVLVYICNPSNVSQMIITTKNVTSVSKLVRSGVGDKNCAIIKKMQLIIGLYTTYVQNIKK